MSRRTKIIAVVCGIAAVLAAWFFAGEIASAFERDGGGT